MFLARISELGEWMAGRGVRIAFHHHMGTVIEKAHEIDRLMEGTPDERRPAVRYRPSHLCRRATLPPWHANGRGRVNHVHAKDVRPDVLERARRERWSFLDAVVNGVFTVPGDGGVDFVAALKPIADAGYDGWLIVEAEQDPAKAPSLDVRQERIRPSQGGRRAGRLPDRLS